jgi:hypothetical protein
MGIDVAGRETTGDTSFGAWREQAWQQVQQPDWPVYDREAWRGTTVEPWLQFPRRWEAVAKVKADVAGVPELPLSGGGGQWSGGGSRGTTGGGVLGGLAGPDTGRTGHPGAGATGGRVYGLESSSGAGVAGGTGEGNSHASSAFAPLQRGGKQNRYWSARGRW